jgi:hypothetical protein
MKRYVHKEDENTLDGPFKIEVNVRGRVAVTYRGRGDGRIIVS